MSAVTRVAAWMESVCVSLVTEDQTAAKPTVPETVTTTGAVSTDSVFVILVPPAPTALRKAALTTATVGAGV